MRVTTYVCAALLYPVFAQTSLPMPTATYFLSPMPRSFILPSCIWTSPWAC